MPVNPEPLPLKDRVVYLRRKGLRKDEIDNNEGKMTPLWAQALSAQSQQIANAPNRIALAELPAQLATIGATPIVTDVADGLYRINWHAKIRVADGVSSSLTISFLWTEDGDAISVSGSAITGNTTSTVQGGVLPLKSDAGVPISYAAAYVSGGGGPAMEYDLYVWLESITGAIEA